MSTLRFASLAIALAVSCMGFTSIAAPAARGAPLQVQVDKSKVDFVEHRMELRMSRPGKVQITVVGESEAVLAEEEKDFSGRPAGLPLILTWIPTSDEPVARIEIRATAADGSWVGTLSRWFVPIPHDDVNFRTDSSEVDGKEAPKLEAAFVKLGEVLDKDKANSREHRNITLYIAGHTDTVGGDGHNLKLSQDRARAIGAWFRKRGVKQPIAYEGFGETSPKVRTADNVDEPRNRRADYILSDEPPTFKTTGFRPSWKRIP